jgi:hypothetical protein
MRIGAYFARGVAGWYAVVALGIGILLAVWAPMLATRAPLWECSPWSLHVVCMLLACGIARLRAGRRGELLTAAQSGVSRRALVLPILLLALGLQVLAAVPPGRLPETAARPGGAGVQRDMSGRLALGQAGHWILVSARKAGEGGRGIEVARLRGGLPADFRQVPANPARYRRQALLTGSLRVGGRDPLDPWVWRLSIALLGNLAACAFWWWPGGPPLRSRPGRASSTRVRTPVRRGAP